jgi:cytochrome P450
METIELAPFSAELKADPYSVYAELRVRGPVHRARFPHSRECWLIVGYQEARAALADPRMRKDPAVAGAEYWEERYFVEHMLNSDPPRHTRLRGLIAGAFTTGRIESMRPRVQQVVDRLLDDMLTHPDGSADLVRDLALPLPITVICDLIGVPDLDRETFSTWSNQTLAPSSHEAYESAYHGLKSYLPELIEAKRRLPGDDLMSDLIRTTDDDGDRLSETELRAMALLLLIAGHETTVNLISNGVRALLEHPGQLAALRADPSLLDSAVEEMLRYEGPVENATLRYTAEPVEIGGTRIPARENVIISLASAHRDPERFTDPDRFDIRRDPRGHIAFGHGLHHCLGAPLARMEGRIAVGTLLERCPDLSLDIDHADLQWWPGLLIRGVRSLPVRFTPC